MQIKYGTVCVNNYTMSYYGHHTNNNFHFLVLNDYKVDFTGANRTENIERAAQAMIKPRFQGPY